MITIKKIENDFYISIAIIAISKNNPSTINRIKNRYSPSPPKNPSAKKSGPIPNPLSIGKIAIVKQRNATITEKAPIGLEFVISITELTTRYNAPTAIIQLKIATGRNVRLNQSGPTPNLFRMGSSPSVNNTSPTMPLRISWNSSMIYSPLITIPTQISFINVVVNILIIRVILLLA